MGGAESIRVASSDSGGGSTVSIGSPVDSGVRQSWVRKLQAKSRQKDTAGAGGASGRATPSAKSPAAGDDEKAAATRFVQASVGAPASVPISRSRRRPAGVSERSQLIEKPAKPRAISSGVTQISWKTVGSNRVQSIGLISVNGIHVNRKPPEISLFAESSGCETSGSAAVST